MPNYRAAKLVLELVGFYGNAVGTKLLVGDQSSGQPVTH